MSTAVKHKTKPEALNVHEDTSLTQSGLEEQKREREYKAQRGHSEHRLGSLSTVCIQMTAFIHRLNQSNTQIQSNTQTM